MSVDQETPTNRYRDDGWDDNDAVQEAIQSGLFVELAAMYRDKCGMGDLREITKAWTIGVGPTDINGYRELGITDFEDMAKLDNAEIRGRIVRNFMEMGITEVDDLLALGEAGFGWPLEAEAVRECGFTTAADILATHKVSTVYCTHWPDTLEELRNRGTLGERLLEVHRMPANTNKMLKRSKKLTSELEALDDNTLKIVVNLFEEVTDLREINVPTVRQYIQAFTS